MMTRRDYHAFSDITAEGSITTGAAVAAVLLVHHWPPLAAMAAAMLAGALAGVVTGMLAMTFQINRLLSGILTMTALYSINLRVMGKPNIALIDEPTVFSLLEFDGLPDYVLKPLVLLAIVVAAKVLIDLFFASEVGLAMDAARALAAEGVRARVVSLPCTNVFDKQDAAYREQVLPSAVRRRVAVEAGVTDYWRKYVGLDGAVIGIDSFGASAPAEALYKHFGITVEAVVAAVKATNA